MVVGQVKDTGITGGTGALDQRQAPDLSGNALMGPRTEDGRSFKVPVLPDKGLIPDISQNSSATLASSAKRFSPDSKTFLGPNIGNLEEIGNLHKDVDHKDAARSIRLKYGVDVSIMGPCRIVNGFLYATGREEHRVDLTNEIYRNGSLHVEYDGKIIFFPGGDSLAGIGAEDVVFVDACGDAPLLFNGNLYSDGRFLVEFGLTYTRSGTPITINGIFFPEPEKFGIVSGKEANRDEACIVMDAYSGSMFIGNRAERKNTDIVFKAGNPFVPVGDHDSLKISLDGALSSLSVERTISGRPTLYAVPGRGQVMISNGGHLYRIDMDEFRWNANFDYMGPVGAQDIRGPRHVEYGSVPFDLLVVDSIRTPVLSRKAPKKIVFDGKQGVAVVPADGPSPEGDICPACDDVEKQVGHILSELHSDRYPINFAFSGLSDGLDKPEYRGNLKARLYRYRSLMPPNMQEALERVTIIEGTPGVHCGFTSKAAGCFHGFKGINLGTDEGLSYSLVFHETAHSLHYMIVVDQILSRSGSRSKYPGDFNKEWRDAARDPDGRLPYDRYLSPVGRMTKMGFIPTNKLYWKDPHPAIWNGHVSPSGNNNIAEDVATFAKLVETRPSELTPHLIPPGQPGHRPEFYDPRYQKKLDLLLRYGFISPEQYRKAVGHPTLTPPA